MTSREQPQTNWYIESKGNYAEGPEGGTGPIPIFPAQIFSKSHSPSAHKYPIGCLGQILIAFPLYHFLMIHPSLSAWNPNSQVTPSACFTPSEPCMQCSKTWSLRLFKSIMIDYYSALFKYGYF